MTIAEVAKLIDKSEQSVRRAVKSGKLNAIMVKGKYKINEDDIPDSLRDTQPIVTDSQGNSQALVTENEQLRQDIERRDNQIAELMEKLHGAEKQAILTDGLLADKERLQQQLDTKDEQIRELQKALDQNQQLLAYAQLPWYRKLRHKALPAPDGVMDMEAEDENPS